MPDCKHCPEHCPRDLTPEEDRVLRQRVEQLIAEDPFRDVPLRPVDDDSDE
jgi:hypothetical protein